MCEVQSRFPFCLNTVQVIVDCLPYLLAKGPVDQPDKAILVPFLRCAESSFKAMQKRELSPHCPSFVVDYGVKSKCEAQTSPCIPRLRPPGRSAEL